MPESKEELFGLLSEFQDKVDLMVKVLNGRFDMLDSFSDREYELLHHYTVLLINTEPLYYELDHIWDK